MDLFESVIECGCAAKVPAQELSEMLRGIDVPTSPEVLVGPETLDDAGVFQFTDEKCLVQTLDVFPPVARDPEEYGRIAAANSLSDIYAVGGTPLTALGIVCVPKLVVPSHGSNVVGTLCPIEEIGKLTSERDLLLCVDAAQTAGAVPIDVRSMHADLLAFTGHKALYGPQGTGGLCIGERARDRLRPLIYGGTGSASDSDVQPEFLPDRFEAGTLNAVGLAGLAAGLAFVENRGLAAIREHEQAFTSRILSCLLFPRFTGSPSSSSRKVMTLAFTLSAARFDFTRMTKSSAQRQYRWPRFSSSWSSSFSTMLDSIGDAGEPCGVPFSVFSRTPSTTTPAFNALAISVTACSSFTLRRTSRRINPCGISSKKLCRSIATPCSYRDSPIHVCSSPSAHPSSWFAVCYVHGFCLMLPPDSHYWVCPCLVGVALPSATAGRVLLQRCAMPGARKYPPAKPWALVCEPLKAA